MPFQWSMQIMMDTLFGYLKDILYDPESAKIDIPSFPDSHKNLALGLQYLHQCMMEQHVFVKGLSRGDMSAPLPASDNPITGDLRSLHNSTSHLIWQAHQIAKGDYSQQLDFMGELSEVFNLMTQQLQDRENSLVKEIEVVKEKNSLLKQSQDLLVTLSDNLLDWVCVLDCTHKICYSNKACKTALDCCTVQEVDDLTAKLCSKKAEHIDSNVVQWEMPFLRESAQVDPQYFSVNIHDTNWNNTPSLLCILKDITSERESNILLLQDSLTGLFNRRYGMKYIQNCIATGMAFEITFIDLDLLKCVNDVHGHHVGDEYIIAAANQLLTLPQPCHVLRLGGDEFLIVSHYKQSIVSYLEPLRNSFINESKAYSRSFSYGVVSSVTDGRDMSNLLQLADFRMYAYKTAHKKNRDGLQPHQ